ncbi:hypothetical protein JXA56_05445 [Candidatus Micrarchaeota archaeon]|nr:hypothetical protein [Candidatus Micrarchaeota archaeon]
MVDVENVTDVLSATINGAVENTVTSAANIFPGLIAAIIIFIIGWIVAVVISGIFSRLLRFLRLEDYLKSHKVDNALGKVMLSNVLTKLLKYYIILIFLQEAVSFLALGTISLFLAGFLFYAPALIAAIVLVLVAILLGEYVKQIILELRNKSTMVQLIARATKFVIIFVGITMAMGTANIDTTLLNGMFIVMLQAVTFGIALAVGIAFGLGGQKDAQQMIGEWRKHLKV